jgi:5-methylcytosine-specific restriction endonuclease McrA
MEKVILLNSDFNYLGVVNWKKAMRLIAKGKVEVLKTTDKIIGTANKNIEIFLPKVIKLIKLARQVYKSKIPYSKKNVLIRDKYTCQYCGNKSKKYMTIDHVIPSSRGGKSSFENCVASCKDCNSKKNNCTPSECKMPLRRQPFRPTIMEFITIKMKELGVDKVLADLWEY